MNNMTQPVFSLIIPTYNEAGNITALLDAVHRAMSSHAYEVIVVDDDSPDQTYKRVADYAAVHPWVRVIRRMNERGLSGAVLAGFEAAKGPILGVMDADLSHDERILP